MIGLLGRYCRRWRDMRGIRCVYRVRHISGEDWPPQHTAPGHKPIFTKISHPNCKYIEDNAVFAFKQSLIVDFKPLEEHPKAEFELPYDCAIAT
jgi:hypothetical protein